MARPVFLAPLEPLIVVRIHVGEPSCRSQHSTITYAAAPEPSTFGLAVSTTPAARESSQYGTGVSLTHERFARRGNKARPVGVSYSNLYDKELPPRRS